MVEQAHWSGTEIEKRDLLRAIERNCECDRETGAQHDVCSAHSIFTGKDAQRVLDALLFGRRIAHRLRFEEFRAS